MKIYLDLDGVLTDFNKAACQAHVRDDPYKDRAYWGEFGIHKAWGITSKEFWSRTHNMDFWWSMDWMPDGRDILHVACEWENPVILTALSTHWTCPAGKYLWIEENLSPLKYAMTMGGKEHYASPDAVLIDDRDKNVEAWRDAGGLGILVPRPWNSRHDTIESLDMKNYIDTSLAKAHRRVHGV